MINSATLYEDTCQFVQGNQNISDINYWQKKFYTQIVTTIFYELLTAKTSPLISKFCADNGINYSAKNFKIDSVRPSSPLLSSYDMNIILLGLVCAIEENLDTCATCIDTRQNKIFRGNSLSPDKFERLYSNLKIIDTCLEKFYHVEQSARSDEEFSLMKNLDELANNRRADDEKIIDETKKVQQNLQDEFNMVQESLKHISEIREEIDYRTLQEPIYQLIELYHKIDDNVKRHPMADTAKGYLSLMKRCENFLRYVKQSLKMLGVEIIDDTGNIFNPAKNKLVDDVAVSNDAVVTKVIRIGFIYKRKVLEKSEVEVDK